MNPEFEKQLEAGIQRELDALGGLQPSPALAGRIMRAIERRAAAPWYRRAWQTWPLPLRGISFAMLLALFGGICIGVVTLSQAVSVSTMGRQAGEWLTGLGALWKAADVLAGALATSVSQLGNGLVMAWLLALALACAACAGLGSVFMRLAVARR